ncbi:synaptotagmin-like 5 [Parelaphostrongylus tenuis]|uniref:Synaptotagmin-like 5 n=1 Tax=Parelaphostrongylus tenuis TaxID=148309 RepID=A0AAD5QST5_PARTN|nr:synaptotagmin-like 5 [Parelaphostrongylus tenuis]
MYSVSTETTRSSQSLDEISAPGETPEPQSGRACCQCKCQLGLIFNSGTRCSQCKRLLCNDCRREATRSKWFCKACYLQRELRAASGEWVDSGGATEISSVLLEHMHRVAADKRQLENKQDLPKRTATSTLAAPTSSQFRAINSEKNSNLTSIARRPNSSEDVRSRRMDRNSKFGTPSSISNENLKHPTDLRPPLERQSASSLVGPAVNVQRLQRIGQPESSPTSGRREMLSSRNSNASSMVSDSVMWRGKPQMDTRKTMGKSEPSLLSPSKLKEAASGGRSTITESPVDIKSATQRDSKADYLDIIGGDSNRSSATSIPTRSTSQDTRLSKLSGATPTSSRDSLRSAGSHITDPSNDLREKSSDALQATTPVLFFGEVQLTVSYDVVSACLSVRIIQCRSLPHFGNHKPNPYVKVVLVPYQSNLPVLRHKTTARKSDFNPFFDQTFQFPRITKSEVDEYRMQVSVWHKDVISQNSLIGELVILLRDYNWANSNPLWYQLEAKTVGSSNESMEDDESESSRSSDILPMGSGTSDRSTVVTGTRRPLLRNSSSSSSSSSFNSRGVRKAVLQRKTDGTTEEREHSTRTGRNSVELEHDVSTTESERSSSKKPETQDQAAEWTIWI